MAVVITRSEIYGPNLHLLEWWSDAPSPQAFDIYVNGTRIAYQTPRTSWRLFVSGGREDEIEIRDGTETLPREKTYGQTATIWWTSSGDDVERYVVRQYINLQWVDVAEVIARSGLATYQWRTPRLDDGTAYLYRVVAVGKNQNESDPLELKFHMVRRPDIADDELQIVYNGTPTRTLTISAVTP